MRCKNSFAQEKNNQSLTQGIGLENVRKRLDLIYPNAHDLRISTDNNYYLVDLTIDL